MGGFLKGTGSMPISKLVAKAKAVGVKVTDIDSYCRHLCYVISVSDRSHILAIPDDVIELSSSTFNLSNHKFGDRLKEFAGEMKVIGGANLESMSYMFKGCSELEYVDLRDLRSSKLRLMDGAFSGCQALKGLKLGDIDTSQVTDMEFMFDSCKSIESLDLSKFKIGNLCLMHGMFKGCKSLRYLDISSFDINNFLDVKYGLQQEGDLNEIEADVKGLKIFKGCNTHGIEAVLPSDRTSKLFFEEALSMITPYNKSGREEFRCVTCGLNQLLLSLKDPDTRDDMFKIFSKNNCIKRIPISSLSALKAENPELYITHIKLELRQSAEDDYAKSGNEQETDESYVRHIFIIPDGVTNSWEYDESNKDELESFVREKTLNPLFGKLSGGVILMGGKDLTDLTYAFYKCKNIDGVDLSYFESEKIKSMHGLFCQMENVVELKVDGVRTNQLRYMSDMFRECVKLPYADLSGFDTSQVVSMRGLFTKTGYSLWGDVKKGVKGIERLDTSNVRDMSHMFEGYKTLDGLDLRNFNTSNVIDMSYMFAEYAHSDALDLSSFDTSKVTSMSHMFKGCKAITGDLRLRNFNTGNVTDMGDMFSWCSLLTSIDLSNFDTSNVTRMDSMFCGCKELRHINISGFDTSNVFDMSSMFYGCSTLSSIDLSNFRTDKVTSMAYMFEECSSLKSLDLSNFNTNRVISLSGMFKDCLGLKSLDLSGFNTTHIWHMWSLFEGCRSLESVDLSTFDTSNVIEMENMFKGCISIKSLDLSNFNTDRVTDMSSMFEGCESLESLDLSNSRLTNIQNMNGIFIKCKKLTDLSIGSWDLSNIKNITSIIRGCKALKLCMDKVFRDRLLQGGKI